MKITEIIAQHITEVFEGGNWTEVNIKNSLQDVDYMEAITVTKASYNTIAALLHHLAFYNDVVTMRLNGVNPAIDETNGFNVPVIRSEAEWEQLKAAVFASVKNLTSTVRNLQDERLQELTISGHSTYYKTLHGIAEHAHYHLGQITLIKKLAKAALRQMAKSNSL